MTTTLRPTGPERNGTAGQRSRAYEVRVNSRPVGAVELGTDRRFGPGVGRIHTLRIDEPDRRRGRGCVAALAAEEVLRGWGCRRIEASVPAEAEPALRLAGMLGYTERNRNLVKRLDGAPELPEGSESRPMSEATFAAWSDEARTTYAQTLAERGISVEEASAKADADHAAALPDGLRTPGAVLRVLAHRGVDVGHLWIAVGRAVAGGLGGYVFDVRVTPEHRGRGHGRTLMRVAEQECATAGVDLLGLNVFADNAPARRLYASLGYEPSEIHLYKQLL